MSTKIIPTNVYFDVPVERLVEIYKVLDTFKPTVELRSSVCLLFVNVCFIEDEHLKTLTTEERDICLQRSYVFMDMVRFIEDKLQSHREILRNTGILTGLGNNDIRNILQRELDKIVGEYDEFDIFHPKTLKQMFLEIMGFYPSFKSCMDAMISQQYKSNKINTPCKIEKGETRCKNCGCRKRRPPKPRPTFGTEYVGGSNRCINTVDWGTRLSNRKDCVSDDIMKNVSKEINKGCFTWTK